MASRTGIAVGQNRGHVTAVIPRAAKPVDRKGVSARCPSFLSSQMDSPVKGVVEY